MSPNATYLMYYKHCVMHTYCTHSTSHAYILYTQYKSCIHTVHTVQVMHTYCTHSTSRAYILYTQYKSCIRTCICTVHTSKSRAYILYTQYKSCIHACTCIQYMHDTHSQMVHLLLGAFETSYRILPCNCVYFPSGTLPGALHDLLFSVAFVCCYCVYFSTLHAIHIWGPYHLASSLFTPYYIHRNTVHNIQYC